ncbi:MAG: ATP-binding cassette domain-containing protein [Deltaproteobacteria bacterium]|nr:ATP-binding cassette domain-containing protein [Deltaproteobacteria bacterium]
MGDVAIRAEKLSKRYNIAKLKKRHTTLSELIAETLKSVLHQNGRSGKSSETFMALTDVSFEIGQGEVVGIIGQNGAGKSTLLKILSRITEPTCGRAEVYGRVGSLLEVGTGFHPELTGRENIYLNGAIIGMKKEQISSRFDEIVDFAEIGKFLDVPVKRYSSGMYVRLGFAVAAHLEPEILLVDEVLAVGDAAFQKKCLDKIRNASKNGQTVIFISHNMIAVNSLCKRVIWVKSGEIVEDGPSADVVRKYLTKSVQDRDLSEEVWDSAAEAPGNDMVRLRRVIVKHQDGRLFDPLSDPLTMQTPFRVEVEYWNLVPAAQLHITLHLYNAEQIIAFTTGNITTAAMPSGLLRSVCYFPGDLLNSGSHRFVVMVVKDTNCVIYSHESRVAFDILDVRERHGSWYGKEPGVVQPVLEWTTEYLGEDGARGQF